MSRVNVLVQSENKSHMSDINVITQKMGKLNYDSHEIAYLVLTTYFYLLN